MVDRQHTHAARAADRGCRTREQRHRTWATLRLRQRQRGHSSGCFEARIGGQLEYDIGRSRGRSGRGHSRSHRDIVAQTEGSRATAATVRRSIQEQSKDSGMETIVGLAVVALGVAWARTFNR